MFVVAMTGGIGAGKSEAAGFFRERGAVVLELDRIAAYVIEPGAPAYDRVVAEFGEGIVGADGRIDRQALAELAFASPEAAERLNAAVHPAIASEVGPSITDLRLLPNPPTVVVIDVPLLVEAPVFGEIADEVLAIEAPEDVRVSRAVARGLSEDDVRARMACQASDEERAAIATTVIVNDGTLDEFRQKLARFWDEAVRDDL